MKFRSTIASLCLALMLGLVFAQSALAQDTYRADDKMFLKARVGLNSYNGDRDTNPDNDFSTRMEYLGGGLGFDLGYKITPALSASFFYLFNNVPRVNEGQRPVGCATNPCGPFNQQPAPFLRAPGLPGDPPGAGLFNTAETSEARHTLALMGSYFFMPTKKVSPYVNLGIGTTLGKTGKPGGGYDSGLNLILGAGLDFAVAEKTGLFIEFDWMNNFDDFSYDGADDIGLLDDQTDFVSYLMVGLRQRLSAVCQPAEVMSVSGLATVVTGEAATFTAVTNDDRATAPMYSWDFGDNNAASGMTATHTYDTPGTYTVTFSAMNCGQVATGTQTVTVNPAVIAPEIIAITANPLTPDTRTLVNFTSNIQGTNPRCRWEFGDGSTSTDCNPSHTYTTPGTYTATLTATNSAGSDSRSITITVSQFEAAICREITEMNSAFFDRNSSVLTETARASLQENLDILSQCANLNVRLEGFAAPGERNAQGLSEDRARAVEQFYRDGGIAASRITAVGMGRVEGATSKKEGAGQFRRVDTIPVR